MGWISEWLGPAKHRPKLKTTGSNQKKRARRSTRSSGTAAAGPTCQYRSVSIYPAANCCAAATRTKGQRFLSAHAPQLPLGGCEQPQQCKCRYKYYVDRRLNEARRDADHGLPGKPFGGNNRRFRRDRRQHPFNLPAH